MKSFFILLISIILITSCKDCPVEYVEVPKGEFININISPNPHRTYFMTDVDTLKIKILDTNLINSFQNNTNLYSASGFYISESNNIALEYVESDLTFKVNPNDLYEMWIMGFEANLDSTRTFGVGKFDYYSLSINFWKIDPYYMGSNITIFVESTTE